MLKVKNKDEEILIEQRWEYDELYEEIEIKTVSARFFAAIFAKNDFDL